MAGGTGRRCPQSARPKGCTELAWEEPVGINAPYFTPEFPKASCWVSVPAPLVLVWFCSFLSCSKTPREGPGTPLALLYCSGLRRAWAGLLTLWGGSTPVCHQDRTRCVSQGAAMRKDIIFPCISGSSKKQFQRGLGIILAVFLRGVPQQGPLHHVQPVRCDQRSEEW